MGRSAIIFAARQRCADGAAVFAALSALAMTQSKLLIALAERGPILRARQEAAIRGANGWPFVIGAGPPPASEPAANAGRTQPIEIRKIEIADVMDCIAKGRAGLRTRAAIWHVFRRHLRDRRPDDDLVRFRHGLSLSRLPVDNGFCPFRPFRRCGDLRNFPPSGDRRAFVLARGHRRGLEPRRARILGGWRWSVSLRSSSGSTWPCSCS